MTHVCRAGHWTGRRPSQASVFPPVRAGSHGPAQRSHRRAPGPGRISRLTRAERPPEGARDTEGRRQGYKVSGGLSGASQPPAHMRVCTMLWGPRDFMERAHSGHPIPHSLRHASPLQPPLTWPNPPPSAPALRGPPWTGVLG